MSLKDNSSEEWAGESQIFSERPYISIRLNGGKRGNLVRLIDETRLIEKKEVGEMTWKQHVLYCLFLYNPKKPEPEFVEPVFREEIIAENVSGFEIVERGKKYCVLYR